MLKAVIFDLDDTLIDWSGVQMSWDDIIGRQVGPMVQQLTDYGYDINRRALVDIIQDKIRNAWMSTSPPEWKAPQHRDLLLNALAELQVEESHHQTVYEKLDWQLIPGVKPFPDAINVLEALKRNGLRCAILTNAAQPMALRDIEIEALGLRDYFDVRFSAADVGTIKPHPRPFQIVLDELNLAPEEAFYIGDRPQDDIVGAQAAGMRAVWVRRAHSSPLSSGIRPNAIVDSLSEMLAVIDRWYPRWRT